MRHLVEVKFFFKKIKKSLATSTLFWSKKPASEHETCQTVPTHAKQ